MRTDKTLPSPITGKPMHLKRDLRMINLSYQTVGAKLFYYLCEDSKEEYTTTRIDEINLYLIRREYNKHFKL